MVLPRTAQRLTQAAPPRQSQPTSLTNQVNETFLFYAFFIFSFFWCLYERIWLHDSDPWLVFSKLFIMLSCTELIGFDIIEVLFHICETWCPWMLKSIFFKLVKFTLIKYGCCSYNNNNGWVEGQVWDVCI